MRSIIHLLPFVLAGCGPQAAPLPPQPVNVATANRPATVDDKQVDIVYAKCVGITDGDTIKVLVGTEQVRLRLEGIDCPERGQPFSDRAKQLTAELCHGKEIGYVENDRDRWGRVIATVYADGRDVSLELLNAGVAWHFKKYNKEERYAEAERKARQRTVGLWSEVDSVPPWEWRSRKP